MTNGIGEKDQTASSHLMTDKDEKDKKIAELEKQVRFLKQQLRDMNRDFQEATRDASAEQRWRDIQGDNYGSY